MLWRAVDGTTFESVLMRYPQRNTACISSQAGCGMACPFCATGQGGLKRNLSTAEILEQVRAAAVELRDRDHGRLSNIVFMGMGEPLANYNRVLEAVRRIIAPPPNGFGISARSVTVSTVGLAPAIRKLADERLGVTLALSLHAPDDELRDTLVPGEQPMEGLRSPRCCPLLRRRDGQAGVDRVRADPRHQRPALARRPTRQAPARCAGSARSRQRHSAEPDTRQRVGRQPEGRRT